MVICEKCGRDVKIYSLPSKKACRKCYDEYFRPKKICSVCGNLRLVSGHNELNEPLCPRCYKTPKNVCSLCGEINHLALSNPATCHRCYNKTYEAPLQICCVCGENRTVEKHTEYGPLCIKCYNKQYEPTLRICGECGEFGVISLIDNGIDICYGCYMRLYYKQPKYICIKCGEERIAGEQTEKGSICKKCWTGSYTAPKKECKKCHELREVAAYCNNQPLCERCYNVIKYNTDEHFRIKTILRERVRGAFNLYSTTGKTQKSDKYGIDYEAIIKHLGSCPGNRENYHIDHIFPLSAFNFDDPKQVKLAFAPENHQWLTKEENLDKRAKYDKEKFQEYLNAD